MVLLSIFCALLGSASTQFVDPLVSMLQPPRQPQILYAIQGPVYVEPSSLETAILTKPVWRSPEVNSPAFEPPVFVTSAFGPPAYGPSALGPPAFMPSTLGHSAFEASIFGPQLGGSPIVGPLVVRPSIFDQPYNGQPQGTLFKPSSFEQPNVETNKASDVGNKVQVSETGHSQNDEPHVRRNQVDFLVHGELYQNDELDGLSDSKNSDQVFLNDDDSNRRGLNLEEGEDSLSITDEYHLETTTSTEENARIEQ